MFSSPCLQQHQWRMSFLSLSLLYLQWVWFLLSIAAQTCSHTYQSFIHMPEEYFFPKDLTDGHAPRFTKVSLETKYNIVVGTQIVLKPKALDGLQRLIGGKGWRWAEWELSATGGHWEGSFVALWCFLCSVMHNIPTEVMSYEWSIIHMTNAWTELNVQNFFSYIQ